MTKIYTLVFLLFSTVSLSQIEEKPCPRNQPVIAYHVKEKAIFLFGGFCSIDKKRLNDLWKFNGKTWIRISTDTVPEARSGHSMIYDHFKSRLLVFGGKNDKGYLLNDLWSWNGFSWKKISEDGPEPRQSLRMVFNSNNGDTFIFGGSNVNGKALNDTWVFRNETWVKLESQNLPPPRLQHTMGYDQVRNRVVLFGGFRRTENGKHVHGDTWEWQISKGWLLKVDDKQMARDHHAMTYDIKNKRTILFGGYNQGYLDDTWGWDGEKWKKLSAIGPSARAGKPGLIFDSLNETLVLFGGWDKNNVPLMDFWQIDYDQQSWEKYFY